jgi:peptide-methionine (S)-S-oxide reductase
MIKKAYFAGGCFWGLEELFRKVEGVTDTEAGYTGGENDHPTYRNHPGHAEALEITYDDEKTSYWKLLDRFFSIHNPTTLNQQGNDIGTSYRSAIFYQSEDEKAQAEAFIALVNASGRWNDPVVTTLEPFSIFWPAEAYHQDYLQQNPGGYTCHLVYFDTYLDVPNAPQEWEGNGAHAIV